MGNTPDLYNSLFQILCQYQYWLDIRHLYTLTWMVVGLIESKSINLTSWAPFVNSRAQYAQSTIRRFSRWLHNERVQVSWLWGPIIRSALLEWGNNKIYLALDTTVLWDRFCHIRISVIYRGRAIPLVWKTIEHASSAVALEDYQDLLRAAAKLLPENAKVMLLTDRGFADTKFMEVLSKELHWHYRIRIKANFYVYRRGRPPVKVRRFSLGRGQALFLHRVYLTKQQYGPVYLALARPLGISEDWYIVSDQPTGEETFDEYGLRFDIEENFLDDKSNGFQLEASQFRSAEAISRLVFVIAAATLFLVSQGVEVVASGKRRWVDPHWSRGSSYLKIGWRWVLRALVKGYDIITQLRLPPGPDPWPAKASNAQASKRRQKRFFRVKTVRFT